MKNSKIKKYLLYSMGEILLVTIGVLLAIQANNWNESLKTKEKTASIYARVFSDIDRNISEAERFLNEYSEMEYLYVKVLNDSVSVNDFYEGLAYLITGVIKYNYDMTGIEQLKAQNLEAENLFEIIKIYETADLDFKSYVKAIEENVQNNLIEWRNEHDWFQHYVNNKITQEAKEYFLESQDYKNRVSYFYLANFEGYLPNVEAFASELKRWKEENLSLIEAHQ